MIKPMMIIATACSLLFTLNVQAGDAAAGKQKSESCVGCHGLNGRSNNPMYPNLAGQKEAYLVKATKEYRDGKRPDAVMGAMVKGLSDEDIANLAAYYSSVK